MDKNELKSKLKQALKTYDICSKIYIEYTENKLFQFQLTKFASMLPDKGKILDAGCGEGHLLEKLNAKNNSHRYYGIDFADISIEESKKRCPSAEIKKMSLAQIDYEADFFDVVTCTEVLEHVKEYEIVLKELKRVVKKEGYLIITFPNEVLWTLSRFLLGRKPIIDL